MERKSILFLILHRFWWLSQLRKLTEKQNQRLVRFVYNSYFHYILNWEEVTVNSCPFMVKFTHKHYRCFIVSIWMKGLLTLFCASGSSISLLCLVLSNRHSAFLEHFQDSEHKVDREAQATSWGYDSFWDNHIVKPEVIISVGTTYLRLNSFNIWLASPEKSNTNGSVDSESCNPSSHPQLNSLDIWVSLWKLIYRFPPADL